MRLGDKKFKNIIISSTLLIFAIFIFLINSNSIIEHIERLKVEIPNNLTINISSNSTFLNFDKILEINFKSKLEWSSKFLKIHLASNKEIIPNISISLFEEDGDLWINDGVIPLSNQNSIIIYVDLNKFNLSEKSEGDKRKAQYFDKILIKFSELESKNVRISLKNIIGGDPRPTSTNEAPLYPFCAN
jgi:hypothetical protein